MNSVARKKRVVVAMSGGVDSSVAAALLLEQGYEVIGMMLRLWNEPGSQSSNRCCSPESMALARRVAAILGIPFYAVDVQQIFYDKVVTYFLDGYAKGTTPNPCLVCNRNIRFEFLLNHAQAIGADFLATGHYARLRMSETKKVQLLKSIDKEKDQSYVLHILDQHQLSLAKFPLGDYTKVQVRQLAEKFALPVANRRDSQDLCFLAGGDYRDFLSRNSTQALSPGWIKNTSGKIIGEHQGLSRYTIGQRKGLNSPSMGKPQYVIEKDIQTNTLFVGTEAELGKSQLIAKGFNWISGEKPRHPIRAVTKIRYKSQDAWSTITPLEDRDTYIQFDKPLRDITPGQAAVIYQNEVCLGGGIIHQAIF